MIRKIKQKQQLENKNKTVYFSNKQKFFTLVVNSKQNIRKTKQGLESVNKVIGIKTVKE